MIKKYKKEIIIFLIGFIIYFILGLLLSHYLNTANFWNVLFDLDTPRVLSDLSLRDFNHYRIAVHPLFIIIFQPIVLLLNFIINDSVISIILIQSLLSSVTLVLLYLSVNKICKNNKLSIIMTILFGLSFSQVVYTSAIETYIYAQFFLILLWFFCLLKIDKKLEYWDYIILVLLGIGSIAITITNLIQFIIAIFFLLILNKKNSHRLFTAMFILAIIVAFSVLLAEIQNIIWPTAPNFFTKAINDFLYSTSEEQLYISTDISARNILNVLNANFAQSFNIFNLVIPESGVYLTFTNSLISNIFSILCGIAFFVLNIVFIKKNIKKISYHKIYLATLFAWIFNFLLHIFYGNNIAFLYVCHYNFLLIFLMAYLIKELFNIKEIKNKWFIIINCLIIALSLRGIILMFYKLIPEYNFIEYFRIMPFIIVALAMSLLLSLTIKNKKAKIFTVLFSWILIGGLNYYLNSDLNSCKNKCNEMDVYKEKLEIYQRQLKDMRNEYIVKSYEDRTEEEKLKIFYFGLANRRKILYKEGKLIDIKTQEIIKEFDYEEELIVPNEYTVLLKNKNGNIYKIYENEKGIYITENGKEIILEKSSQTLNLPEFENYKYSELLKVLHQEILFNIDGEIPKPNLVGYDTAWYRDTMLGTKVLEITNNTHLLIEWVKSIDSIYDYSRSENIKETDNLGELLYIIGAIGVERKDLIKDIKEEINNIKQPDGSIKGNVDGLIQAYYPTVLALYGAEKAGISLNLAVPQYDDGYAKLTWYYKYTIASNNTIHTKYYPYINWAFYHYSPYSTLYILDEEYPLSYEGGDTSTPGRVEEECFISQYYCEKQLYLSHMWHASEMFLFLEKEK